MDTESGQNVTSSLPAASGSGSFIVKLHPLVVMNISDHWIRVRAQTETAQKVYGALIGKQNGRVMEVMNSFELLYKEDEDDGLVIDKAYFYTKEAQFKQVFKDIDFQGWYSTGGDLSDLDVKVHCQICSIIENPIFLKLNPNSPPGHQNISTFESVIDLDDGNAVTRLLPLNYTLTTEEAERIGIDHVARATNAESEDVSAASEHLRSQHSSIMMLYTRIRFILNYLQAVRDGELPCDHETLRSVHALCRRLPVLGGDHLTEELHDQYNDVTLMAYLGVMNKGSQAMNTFISKFNLLYDRHVRRSRNVIV